MAISQNDHVTVINTDDDNNNDDNNNDDNNDEYYNDETDDETDDEANEYEPEETSNTRFNITVCELYNTAVHGPPAFNSLHAHYIVLHRLKKYDERLIDKIIYNYTKKIKFGTL